MNTSAKMLGRLEASGTALLRRPMQRDFILRLRVSRAVATLRDDLADPELRAALAECLVRKDWYDSIGFAADLIEIPPALKEFVERLIRRRLLDMLVPPGKLWRARRLWDEPWELADEFQVPDELAEEAVGLALKRHRKGRRDRGPV